MTPCRLVLVALSLGLLSVAPARAEEPVGAVGPWKTGLMSQQDGTFAYCVTEAPFPGGQWILFALNPQQEVNLGFGQESARMEVGSRRSVTVEVDGQKVVLPAQATKPQLMVMSAHRAPDLIGRLATGQTLGIDGRSFALSGSGEAIAELRECVRVSSARGSGGAGVGAASVSQTPPSTVAPSASIPASAADTPQVSFDEGSRGASVAADTRDVSLPGERGMAPPPGATIGTGTGVPSLVPPVARPSAPPVLPSGLVRILDQAGLKGVVPSTPRLGREMYRWMTSSGLEGSIYETVVPPGQPLTAYARQFLSREADDCGVGLFKSDLGQGEGKGTISRLGASARCRSEGGEVFSTYVFSLAPNGVLSVLTHRQANGEKEANAARSGLVRALRAFDP